MYMRARPPALALPACSSLYEQSNQYPPMMGVPELRQAVAAHSGRHAGIPVDWQTESLITLGATEALAAAFLGLLNAGDEVIMFEPLYDSYVPMARRAGGVPRWACSRRCAGCVAPGLVAILPFWELSPATWQPPFPRRFTAFWCCILPCQSRPPCRIVQLHPPGWSLVPAELEAAFTPRTKLLVLNTPHNPTGKVGKGWGKETRRRDWGREVDREAATGGLCGMANMCSEQHTTICTPHCIFLRLQVFSAAELQLVASLCQRHDCLVLLDEVYEHLVYPGAQHISHRSLPGMAGRCLRIGSAGKTFSYTGWKVGWLTGPRDMVAAVAKAHQFLTFTVSPALQVGTAAVPSCPLERAPLWPEVVCAGQPVPCRTPTATHAGTKCCIAFAAARNSLWAGPGAAVLLRPGVDAAPEAAAAGGAACGDGLQSPACRGEPPPLPLLAIIPYHLSLPPVPEHQCSKADLIADQPVASSGLPVAAQLHMLCHAVPCCAMLCSCREPTSWWPTLQDCCQRAAQRMMWR